MGNNYGLNKNNDLVESDFAQLTIMKKLVKTLRYESGVLQSERDEFKDRVSQLEEEISKLVPPELKLTKDEILIHNSSSRAKLVEKNKLLERTNQDLIIKVVKLQNQLDAK